MAVGWLSKVVFSALDITKRQKLMAKIIKELDYLLGYELALKNSTNHFEAAELIAKNISFGIANSHLVLAAEEAVKAIQLLIIHYYPESKSEDLNKMFSNHKYKHETIRSAEAFGFLIEGLMKHICDPILSLLQLNDKPSTYQIKKSRRAGIDSSIEWMKRLVEGVEKSDFNDDWWKQADYNKNKGFYVNINNKNSKWETPEQISEKFYQKSNKIVASFIQKAKMLKELFTDDEIKEFYITSMKELDKSIK